MPLQLWVNADSPFLDSLVTVCNMPLQLWVNADSPFLPCLVFYDSKLTHIKYLIPP